MKKYQFLAAKDSMAIRNFDDKNTNDGTKFERDKNRIMFSKEFRRLDGKTQVFLTGYDDHVRNRLTHTLEVSLISQVIANLFGFNKTLTEAIALGHDVGHTPFGHVGERVLNHLTNNCDSFKDFKSQVTQLGFKHNWQGIKVVSTLEKISPDFQGLNLTDYTLWGILNHSRLEYDPCKKINKGKCSYYHNGSACHLENQKFSLTHYKKFTKYIRPESWSFEGYIVNISDEIAQRHHDIEDGLIAGIIDINDLINRFTTIFADFLSTKERKKIKTIQKSSTLNYAIYNFSHLIINFYIDNLFVEVRKNLEKFVQMNEIKSVGHFYELKNQNRFKYPFEEVISFTNEFKAGDKEFQKFLFNRVLNSHLAQLMDGKATFILKSLIEAYLTNPKQLPDGTVITLFNNFLSQEDFEIINNTGNSKIVSGKFRAEIDKYHNTNNSKFKTVLIRTVTDFIAGMTDNFAISQYHMLYGSDNYWKK